MIDDNVSEIFFNLPFAWANVGEELRTEYLNRLASIPLPKTYTAGTDESFAVNFSNSQYDQGKLCVYAWVTEQGNLFYIGMGDKVRCTNIHSRNDNFKQKCTISPCKVYILASFVRVQSADIIESLCIELAQLKGWNLTNSQKMLSADEITQIKSRSRGLAYKKYVEMVNTYPQIVEAFNRFNSFLLSQILSEDGKLIDKTNLRVFGKGRKDTRVFWEIDGKTDLASRWCKLYKINRATVTDRMVRGLTLKEALTFPKVPQSQVGAGRLYPNSIAYWESIGLKIGVDDSARELRL